jgi:hypothetical protein
MTIPAAYFALLDLGLDRAPAETTTEHFADVISLFSDVIELKNDGVRLAAVDASVLGQVCPSARLILERAALEICLDLIAMVIAVL